MSDTFDLIEPLWAIAEHLKDLKKIEAIKILTNIKIREDMYLIDDLKCQLKGLEHDYKDNELTKDILKSLIKFCSVENK